MFTGIIETVGRISALESIGGDRRLHVDCGRLDLSDLSPGASIAINGVCLSAVTLGDAGFAADVSIETLSCTTLSQLVAGSRVNIERALLPTTRLGGHLVSGHVDGVGRVQAVRDAGRSRLLRIGLPSGLARYIAAKGSVCVDGVSLTVNEISGMEFTVNIIPHTLEQTIIGEYREGSIVNIEVDIIARYLEGLLAARMDPADTVDRAVLKKHGVLPDG